MSNRIKSFLSSKITLATVVFFATAVVTLVISIYLYERPNFSDNVVVSDFESEILGEQRQLIVHLPESYALDPSRHYPVMYVLDGTSQDIHTAFSAALMARIDLMPEIIVVGLPNTSGPNRQRDYTPPFMPMDLEDPDRGPGEGDRFLSFIRQEVMPRIESEYRTTGCRMIAGNSRGGLLVAYSLIHEPTLFSARFSHSPALWREDEMMVDRLTDFLKSGGHEPSFFYMSMGENEVEKMISAFELASDSLTRHARPPLRWQAEFTSGAHHGNNAVRATPKGLHAFYSLLKTAQQSHPESPKACLSLQFTS